MKQKKENEIDPLSKTVTKLLQQVVGEGFVAPITITITGKNGYRWVTRVASASAFGASRPETVEESGSRSGAVLPFNIEFADSNNRQKSWTFDLRSIHPN